MRSPYINNRYPKTPLAAGRFLHFISSLNWHVRRGKVGKWHHLCMVYDAASSCITLWRSCAYLKLHSNQQDGRPATSFCYFVYFVCRKVQLLPLDWQIKYIYIYLYLYLYIYIYIYIFMNIPVFHSLSHPLSCWNYWCLTVVGSDVFQDDGSSRALLYWARCDVYTVYKTWCTLAPLHPCLFGPHKICEIIQAKHTQKDILI